MNKLSALLSQLKRLGEQLRLARKRATEAWETLHFVHQALGEFGYTIREAEVALHVIIEDLEKLAEGDD